MNGLAMIVELQCETYDIVTGLLDQFERGKISRRTLVQSIAAGVATTAEVIPAKAASSGGKGFKAVAVNHISYGVADYGRTRDFYADLLGRDIDGLLVSKPSLAVDVVTGSSS